MTSWKWANSARLIDCLIGTIASLNSASFEDVILPYSRRMTAPSMDFGAIRKIKNRIDGRFQAIFYDL
jgi:hypothetical protein